MAADPSRDLRHLHRGVEPRGHNVGCGSPCGSGGRAQPPQRCRTGSAGKGASSADSRDRADQPAGRPSAGSHHSPVRPHSAGASPESATAPHAGRGDRAGPCWHSADSRRRVRVALPGMWRTAHDARADSCGDGDAQELRWRAEITAALGDVACGVHSGLEHRYLRDVERPHGLPRAIRQARVVRGRRTEYRDVLYEDYLVVVEVDGAAAHPAEDRWLAAHRDNAGAADGTITLRYSWADVTTRPCEVAAEIGAVLLRRGWPGALRRCGTECRIGGIPLALSAPGRRPTPSDRG
jgi:hypothetical protein